MAEPSSAGAPRRSGLSVVVPTRDRPELLERCLEALEQSLAEHDELIVVDSCSELADRVCAVAFEHEARFVRCDRPGASMARNAGWRAAMYDLVAFVDDDVVVDTGWADQIVAAFRQRDVAFVTGRVGLPADQRDIEAPVAVKDDAIAVYLDGDPAVHPGSSNNLAVRRDVLVALGGFDELLGPGRRFRAAEDGDLFDRLVDGGWRGWYEPAATAVHVQWRGRRGRLLGVAWAYGLGAGARLSKVARRDRARFFALARQLLWRKGLATVVPDLRAGYQFGALSALVRAAGTLVGFVWGLATPLDRGVFTTSATSGARSAGDHAGERPQPEPAP